MGRGKIWTKTESKESRRPRGGLGVVSWRREGLSGP